MRVVRMYSGTVAGSQDWKKVEVEVDENDLASILYEIGANDLDREKIKTKYAFQLLTYEAEILLKTTMVQSFEVDRETVMQELQKLREAKDRVVYQLLTELKPSEDGS